MPSTHPYCLPLLVLLLAPLAQAHHSPAMYYDLTQEFEIQGVVTRYELGNPHLRIFFDVDKDGTSEQWMAEGGSRTVLMRKGWDGSEVSPGDEITVRGHPTRDGSKVIHAVHLILPDGTELYAEDLNTDNLEERRRRQR
jgi:hypothetical protein